MLLIAARRSVSMSLKSISLLSFRQHSKLSCSAHRSSLPAAVHVDQGQWRFFVQLVDLGDPFLQLLVGVAVVVSLPCLVVPPPFIVVVNANHKRRLS